MNNKPLLFGLALASSLISTSAFAETGGDVFEAQLSITAPIVDQHITVDNDWQEYEHASDFWAGIGGTLSFGYRWHVVGLYFDQDLGGVWWTGENSDDSKPTFIGGSYLTCRAFLPLRAKAEINFALGLGAMYSGGKAIDGNLLVYNGEGERSVALAIKAGVNMTYYVTESIGIGLNLDYNLGLNFFTVSGDIMNHLIHHINPGIHLKTQF